MSKREIRNRIGELIAIGKRTGDPERYSYRAIAEATGLSKTTVGKWARNEVEAYDRRSLATFCDFFGVPPGEIIVYEEVEV